LPRRWGDFYSFGGGAEMRVLEKMNLCLNNVERAVEAHSCCDVVKQT